MKLSNLILRAIFLTAIISTLFAFLISIFFEYQNFQNEKLQMRKEFLYLKKEEIKREVQKAYSIIEYQQQKVEDKLKNDLKNRVLIAHKIATNIYNENKNTKNDEEIKYLIVTALKNIEFDLRTYYFINSNKGEAVLFNKKSKLNENSNIWNLQDKTGKYIIQEQSKIALSKGEGFLKTHFVKPDLNDNIQYPKLSFVKHFEPFNWHIGMGGYLDDVEKELKNDILEYIATIRFAEDGYIFVNRIDEKALVFDGKKLPSPMPYSNKNLFQKQLDILKISDEGFFFYQFKKLNTQKEFPKLGYIKSYAKWGWIIGSGVYIDEIDGELKEKENLIKRVIVNEANTILAILFIIILLVYFISRRITSYIEININNLVEAFKTATLRSKEINSDELTFKEFKVLAEDLNKTLKLKNSAENKIKDYLNIINQNVIISSTDAKGIITDVNDAFCNISGYSREELINKSHNIVRHEDMSNELYKQMWESIKNNIPWSGELKNKNKYGSYYWVKISIYPNFEKDKLIGYTAIKQDITDKKRVEYLSITDELTQMYNRRFFNIKIEEELKRARREDSFITFLMIDIDYFKKYNDNYGHQKGDDTLIKVAKVILANMKRAGDYGFRLGGEEFGILFCLKENPEKSIGLARRIKEEVENLKIEHKASLVNKYITISIGLVIKRANNVKSSSELYKEADEALYKAKEEGRNCVCMNY